MFTIWSLFFLKISIEVIFVIFIFPDPKNCVRKIYSPRLVLWGWRCVVYEAFIVRSLSKLQPILWKLTDMWTTIFTIFPFFSLKMFDIILYFDRPRAFLNFLKVDSRWSLIFWNFLISIFIRVILKNSVLGRFFFLTNFWNLVISPPKIIHLDLTVAKWPNILFWDGYRPSLKEGHY